MDNAGALLNELTRSKVRLVGLHGHKHHQHFARIVVNSSVVTPYAEDSRRSLRRHPDQGSKKRWLVLAWVQHNRRRLGVQGSHNDVQGTARVRDVRARSLI